MKAKKIINLCEDNQLTEDECREHLSFYFIRKFRSLNAEIDIVGDESPSATIKIHLSNNNKFDLIEYVKELRSFMGVLKTNTFSTDNSIYVNLWLISSDVKLALLSLLIDASSSKFLILTTSFIVASKHFYVKLSKLSEFATEQALRQHIYPLIDIMIKAIRLIPPE